jgi:hypothetical protein
MTRRSSSTHGPGEYDPTLDVRATLITAVLEALRAQRRRRRSGKRRKTRSQGLLSASSGQKAITLASRSAVTFTLPSPEKLLEIFGDKAQVADPTLQGFRKEFAELMGEFEDVKRVVVLVDDLDRCLPESVVMTLEAIKLFLSVQKMAFVIAADEALVKAAIAPAPPPMRWRTRSEVCVSPRAADRRTHSCPRRAA